MKIKIKNKIVLSLGLATFVILYFYFENLNKKHIAIESFRSCVAAGYPLLKTYPERCKIPGKIFENPLQVAQPIQKVITGTSTPNSLNHKNLTYSIEGSLFTMNNGKAFIAPNANTKATTTVSYFGNEVRTDFNNDKENDIAFLFTSTDEIGGLKFYLTTALQREKMYTGTNAIILGEDITPLSTRYENGNIVVRFTKKISPTKIQIRYFVIENNVLQEILHY
jgi:hypothetical protein